MMFCVKEESRMAKKAKKKVVKSEVKKAKKK